MNLITAYDLDIVQCFHRWNLRSQHGRHTDIPTECIHLSGKGRGRLGIPACLAHLLSRWMVLKET